MDDSNNCIAGKDLTELVVYVEDYMKLLSKFYAANKLRLKPDKTCFLMTGSRYQHNRNLRVKLKLDNDIVIEDSLPIKVLGWWVSPDGKLTDHINRIKGPVYKQLSKLKPILKYLNIKERKYIVYAKALGIARYGLCLYAGQTEDIKNKYESFFL